MRTEIITAIIGGIGLFILGMILMTEGLKSLAGDTLRRGFSRFTGGRISSILSGAGITALVQSSHATIIATIGFVSAGLITFEQSLGIILGAHLGTTSTGWLVSILGMKLKFGALALPVVGVGAFLRLLGKDRVASAGLVCAGFGVIFFGIDVLQGGMKNLAGYIDLTGLGETGLVNRLILVAIGVAMTVVMQASSAAVVTTMAALGSGAIDLVQAAALVIGQNIGTTLTAAIAGIGATSSARRTAAAHILFNVVTGIIAFVILPYFLSFVQTAMGVFGIVDPAITLAAFHSAFNILGIIVILPFIGTFSKLLIRIIPERGPYLTRHLDSSVITLPSVALETVRRTVIDITVASIDIVRDMITYGDDKPGIRSRLNEAGVALNDVRGFLGKIKTTKGASTAYGNRLIYILHAIDHVDQLVIACREFSKLATMRKDTGLNNLACMLAENMEPILVRLEGLKKKESVQEMQNASRYMKGLRQHEREEILKRTASGSIDPDTAMRQIEAIRWLDRVTYRIFRALYYLGYHTEEGAEGAYGEELS